MNFEELRTQLGKGSVITEKESLNAYQQSTIPYKKDIICIVKPNNIEELKTSVKFASRYNIPIYPISTGKNWGYGSRTPCQDGSIIIDLGLLNKIQEYNEEMGYVVLEPGVSQGQLFQYLKDNKSSFFFSVTGASPNSSIIGNIIERGIGIGPRGDRFNSACNFEIMLASGEIIKTGYGRFGNSKLANVAKWGVGPSIDGLFTQSNLGIITKMTLWLTPIPEKLNVISIKIDEDGLCGTLDVIRILKLKQLLNGNIGFRNDYKMAASMVDYPDKDALNGLSRQKWLEAFRNSHQLSRWIGQGAIYSASSDLATAELNYISKAVRPYIKEWEIFEVPVTNINDMAYDNYYPLALWLGKPIESGVKSVYWKQPQLLISKDPDIDGCGLVMLNFLLPLIGSDICAAVSLSERTVINYGFVPCLGLYTITDRAISLTISILFDKQEESHAVNLCYKELFNRLMEQGFFPHRLDVQAMTHDVFDDDFQANIMKPIKQALDPNHIIAPNRYIKSF